MLHKMDLYDTTYPGAINISAGQCRSIPRYARHGRSCAIHGCQSIRSPTPALNQMRHREVPARAMSGWGQSRRRANADTPRRRRAQVRRRKADIAYPPPHHGARGRHGV